MNAVIYYSNTGKSLDIARYFSDKLKYPLLSLEKIEFHSFKNLVIVFPVLCQNIPDDIKAFLKRASVEYLTPIATYGKMCRGNVLHEIQNKYKMNIVAAAYVPTKHAYIKDDGDFSCYEKLMPIIEKIKNPETVILPRLYKNPLADIFPKARSRAGLKIRKNSNCNACNVCAEVCPQNAIRSGITNKKCIRCLRCVEKCPSHALEIKIGLPLKLYLKKNKINKTVIYV